ncbi:unnamed protein product [marine sediment metagenome]|uniref:Uncharacterized protein n=1 Tax=marine sediment metagenome TaxID=412755 RepID=X1ELT4_9ZZZZ
MVEGIRVISTQQIEQMLPTGQVKSVYRAHVETDLGAQGILIVSAENWNVPDLAIALAKKRDELDLAFVAVAAD